MIRDCVSPLGPSSDQTNYSRAVSETTALWMNGDTRITPGSIASQDRLQHVSQYETTGSPPEPACTVPIVVATADVMAAWMTP